MTSNAIYELHSAKPIKLKGIDQPGRLSVVLGIALLVGCGASSASSNVGVARSPRGPNCDLTLISPSDVYPGAKYANDYEVIGMVSVDAKTGAQATDPEVKEQVRGKACELGGELIALTNSTTQQSRVGIELGQRLNFAVYAKKVTSAPQKY